MEPHGIKRTTNKTKRKRTGYNRSHITVIFLFQLNLLHLEPYVDLKEPQIQISCSRNRSQMQVDAIMVQDKLSHLISTSKWPLYSRIPVLIFTLRTQWSWNSLLWCHNSCFRFPYFDSSKNTVLSFRCVCSNVQSEWPHFLWSTFGSYRGFLTWTDPKQARHFQAFLDFCESHSLFRLVTKGTSGNKVLGLVLCCRSSII